MRCDLHSVLLLLFCFAQPWVALSQGALKTGMQSLPGKVPEVTDRNQQIAYDFDLATEKFYVVMPRNYQADRTFGVFVFLSPEDVFTALPTGWDRVMEERKLILIAPQGVGNNQQVSRRAGLAVVSSLQLRSMGGTDTNRVFVGGFSGGARIASFVAFAHPAIFAGVISICGFNFNRKVARVKATRPDEYGYFSIDAGHAEAAKRRVRFVLITGSKDFRYGNILDIYEGGLQKDGYCAKLLDVPGMEHALCPAGPLREGLEFLEFKAPIASGAR